MASRKPKLKPEPVRPPGAPPSTSSLGGGGGTRPGAQLVGRRHPEFLEHQLRWRWLLDSLEGGERYRQAIYGFDRRGLPVRNLIRHKREYPDPRESGGAPMLGAYGIGGPVGADPAFPATDDDYELRRARTPVPTFVKEALTDHLDRVYAREVQRSGPAPLETWWADVDGKGTPVDHWMHRTIGPVLLAAGCLDIAMDHPAAPPGEPVATKADSDRLKLGACVASYILPENMIWWRLDPRGRYVENLVREYPDGNDQPDALRTPGAPFPGAAPLAPSGVMNPVDPQARYRHWTATESVLYDSDGRELERHPHGFGRVPIVRIFAARKARCGNVGQSDYEGVAERQREYYNRDSELILSDTVQAFPLLQGPEDFVQADGTVPVGPGWLLPKKKCNSGGTTTYEGFDVVDFPKGAAESIRRNKADLRDDVDRDAALAKPAGSAAAGSGTVSQSGTSKGYDNDRLVNKLSGVADALMQAERQLAELGLGVLTDGKTTKLGDDVTIEYSHQFDLATVDDLRQQVAGLLTVADSPAAGRLPTITGEFLRAMVRQALPGRDDTTYEEWDAEIDEALKQAAAQAALPAPPEHLLPTVGSATATQTDATPLGHGATAGDLASALSHFDRHAGDLKGLLHAAKGKPRAKAKPKGGQAK